MSGECSVSTSHYGSRSVTVYNFGNARPLDPVVLASGMDSLSGWSWFGIRGNAVIYRTGEKVLAHGAMEYVMFAAAVHRRPQVSERKRRRLDDDIQRIFMHMTRSVSEQNKCDVFGAVVEPMPHELEMIEDAVYSHPLQQP